MTCIVRLLEEPRVKDPVLIEGLPGIGFVANIAAMHIIRELGARRFAVITSSSFQDFAMTVEGGGIRTPINELYYCANRYIILYGNTQANTNTGQYELCWRVLELAKRYGCRLVLTMGGYRRERVRERRRVFCAATSEELLEKAKKLCDGVIVGNIYGAAGLLLGLGKLMGMEGVCFLGETPGYYPDAKAAMEVLKVVSKFLGMEIDLSRLEQAAVVTEDMLKGLLAKTREKERFPRPR